MNNDDKRDRWTPMIEASHPLQTGNHAAYETALEMVGNRHSKGALVDLVCWLVTRVDMAEDDLRKLRRRNAGVGAVAPAAPPSVAASNTERVVFKCDNPGGCCFPKQPCLASCNLTVNCAPSAGVEGTSK